MRQPAKTKAIRIQLLGDAGVGKTSLILSLISEEFFDGRCLSTLPDDGTRLSFPGTTNDQCDLLASSTTCEDIFIPAEITITRTPCIICDLSSSCSEDDIVEAIKLADAICIVYSCGSEQSKTDIGERWIPLVLKASPDDELGEKAKPSIIVASKCDLSETNGILADSYIEALIVKYKWIHCRIECSALRMHNVAELFYYAQKIVLYPIDPLFECNPRRLRPDFESALKHIFHIMDKRQLGRIDDDTLNRLQQLAVPCGYVRPKVYWSSSTPEQLSNGIKLTSDDLEQLKRMLCGNETRTQDDRLVEHLDHNEITESGFLCLFSMLLQRDLSETAWAFLQVFFDGSFRFHSREEEVLRELQLSANRKGLSLMVDLSEDSIDFLRSLYRQHKCAQHKVFNWPSPHSIKQSIFKFLQPAPDHRELLQNVLCTREAEPPNTEYVGEEQFILWWRYHIHDNPSKTLLWLDQLGFKFWMTDITEMRCPSSFVTRHKTAGMQATTMVCTIFAEPSRLATSLLCDMVKAPDDADVQHWLVCKLDKCVHCSKHVDKVLIVKSYNDDFSIGNTDWVGCSDLLVLICDLVDNDSCQQVLKLCYASGKTTNEQGLNDNNSSIDEKRLAFDNPPILLVAVNNDICDETSSNFKAIGQMKSVCPNLLTNIVTINSAAVQSGQWGSFVLEHIKSWALGSSCQSLRCQDNVGAWSYWNILFNIPNSILSSTSDFLWTLAMKFKLTEQSVLDKLRACTIDDRLFCTCCWCMMLSSSAAVGCIAIILFKQLGRRSISSAGITKSVFI